MTKMKTDILPEINVTNRIPILKMALLIEAIISDLVANLLGIADYKTAKSLSKSSSLSFYQKIILLIDIGALDKKAQNIFTKFMEIRNTFMHDIWADTYEKCIARTDGLDNWLLKTYPQLELLSKEEQLELAVGDLSRAVVGNTLQIAELVMAKEMSKGTINIDTIITETTLKELNKNM